MIELHFGRETCKPRELVRRLCEENIKEERAGCDRLREQPQKVFHRRQVTRPLYESRLAKLELKPEERPRLDVEFEEVTEGEEGYVKEKLKTKWAALEAIVGTEKRIALIADDLVRHFEERLAAMNGKAMVVCMSRRICVDMYNAIVRLRPQWHHPDDGGVGLPVDVLYPPTGAQFGRRKPASNSTRKTARVLAASMPRRHQPCNDLSISCHLFRFVVCIHVAGEDDDLAPLAETVLDDPERLPLLGRGLFAVRAERLTKGSAERATCRPASEDIEECRALRRLLT